MVQLIRILAVLLLSISSTHAQNAFYWVAANNSAAATFDPTKKGDKAALSNGNMTIATTGGSVNSACAITTAMSSGKYYIEFTIGASIGNTIDAGIINSSAIIASEFNSGARIGNTVNGWAYTSNNGSNNGRRHSGSLVAFGAPVVATNVIGIALDLTNGFMYVAKNNVWMNSGVPTSGATGTGAMYSIPVGDTYFFAAGVHSTGTVTITHTYLPPTGYTAL